MDEKRKEHNNEVMAAIEAVNQAVHNLTMICKSKDDMVELQADTGSGAHLENCIAKRVQSESDAMISEGSNEIMAREHRLRVLVGHDENGASIIKRVSAYDELSLADKIVEAVVRSGRIKEFLGRDIEVGPNIAALLAQPLPPPPKKTRFADYIDHWRKTYKQGLEKTTEVFMNAKQSVLNRWFGEMNIEDITPAAVQEFLTERAKTYKKATVKADWAVLKEVLDSAVSDHIIKMNPAKDSRVKNPAKAGDGTPALTREQVIAIQKEIPNLQDLTERCLIALLAYTSMRREEVLGLTWENVKFDQRVIEITQAIVYPVGATVSKGTKNDFSRRAFPMGQELFDILWNCRKNDGYVISKGEGRPITADGYRKLWKSLSSHIELYGMTAINFRTTFCTMMVASGVDIKTAQALMGHATPEMTLKIYAKQEESRIPDAIEKVSSFLAAQ